LAVARARLDQARTEWQWLNFIYQLQNIKPFSGTIDRIKKLGSLIDEGELLAFLITVKCLPISMYLARIFRL
jgi:hypothetical protein